jgi:hypothetical protein
MIADAFSWNFWEFYKEVKAQIPDDSRVRECWDKPDPFPAEPKLSTQDFLRYRDDDRIWWWKPGCSLQFSDSQKAWFQRWKQVLNKYAKAPAADASIVIQQFLALIYDMEYGDGNSIYLFETLFYDFLTSASAPMTQAAIRYLEEQWKSYKAHHRDRQYTLIRRYIAALANRDFRQEFLGF